MRSTTTAELWMAPYTWRTCLLVILVVATGFRLYGLDFQSLWLNELDSWWIRQHDDLRIVLGRGVMEDLHPPGYQVLLYLVIHVFGDSEVILRLPSSIAGVSSVYVIALLGRRLYNPATGLVAGALLSCLWVPIYYSKKPAHTHCWCSRASRRHTSLSKFVSKPRRLTPQNGLQEFPTFCPRRLLAIYTTSAYWLSPSTRRCWYSGWV